MSYDVWKTNKMCVSEIVDSLACPKPSVDDFFIVLEGL